MHIHKKNNEIYSLGNYFDIYKRDKFRVKILANKKEKEYIGKWM